MVPRFNPGDIICVEGGGRPVFGQFIIAKDKNGSNNVLLRQYNSGDGNAVLYAFADDLPSEQNKPSGNFF